MRRFTLYILFLLCSAYSFVFTLQSEVWVTSNTSYLRDITPGFTFLKNNNNISSANNLRLGLSASHGILNADFMAAGKYFYYDVYGELSDNQTEADLYVLTAGINTGWASVKAGRQFHGEQNTLLPYYGLYDDFLPHGASSLDAVTLGFDPLSWLSFYAIAGKETETIFETEKGDLYGASITLRPFSIWSITPFAYNLRSDDGSSKRNIYVYGGHTTLDLTEDTNLYFSYAKNKNGGNYSKGHDMSAGAFLLKANSQGENKAGFYKLRFMYVKAEGMDDYDDSPAFEGIHNYVYLGSIFTGTDINNIGVLPDQRRYSTAGSVNNITAYNLGATFVPGFAKFLKLDFDIYSISETGIISDGLHIGTEMDIALTVTPFKNMDLTFIYARFNPDEYYDARYPAPVIVQDITQYAFKFKYKF
ncbi:hypothetical protein AAIR98_001524 [Elusimicrobium simillimum]|uniref:hypothetical protein n=1 Tax=Elusimicrobium simillimum TaxID=3143438 RepID=UPI003C6FC9D2